MAQTGLPTVVHTERRQIPSEAQRLSRIFDMQINPSEEPDVTLPEEPINRIVRPLLRFLRIQAASGGVLLMLTVISLILANSPLQEEFLALWQAPIGVSIGSFQMLHPLKHWINDGLMVLFFFAVGLELKRECVLGELKSARAVALPIAAAVGGMLFPAAMYLAVHGGTPAARGWGVPVATDIAFVLGCLALVGSRVPHALRVMLVSLAMADDVGAILIIAIGYSEEIHLLPLVGGLCGIGVMKLVSLAGVRSVPVYVAIGIAVWLCFHESGIHATIAGVLIGLLTPVKSWVSEDLLLRFVQRLMTSLRGDTYYDTHERVAAIRTVERATRESLSPVDRFETLLQPWVAFAVMPLFAFANAGVPVYLNQLGDSVTVAVALGLIVGKPVGIVSCSWLAVRLRIAKLPDGVSWLQIIGGGILSGIGFTMSLFIANIALSDALLDAAKVGILMGSAACAMLGLAILYLVCPAMNERS